MIIDCHGHYTTAPASLQEFRERQIGCNCDAHKLARLTLPYVSDDEIRDSLEGAQLKLQRERGTDLTIFSPRASAMRSAAKRLSTVKACSRTIRSSPCVASMSPPAQ